MLKHFLERADFDGLPFVPFRGQCLKDGFVLRLRIDALPERAEETVLCSLPGTLQLVTRLAAPVKPGSYEYGDHYASWPDGDGKLPVLEAVVEVESEFRPQWKTIRMGVPLTLYDARKSDLYLIWDGVHLRWVFEHEIVNEDYPVGAPAAPTGELVMAPGLCCDWSPDVQAVTYTPCTVESGSSINYYSPPGYNTWAGDAVNYWKDGVYHLLYLHDRHHHRSRWGGGAHHFRHIITRDFVNWEDLGPMFPLTEQWQSVGTGTMFSFEDKLWLSFGWHTSRVVPEAHLKASEIKTRFEAAGETAPIEYKTLREGGDFPNGANLAVSEDGVHFRLAEKMYHWVENPSVYENPDGGLKMYGGYGNDQRFSWSAPRPEGPWKTTETDFDPDGFRSRMRHSTECPSFFEKDGYKYLIMGITGYWRTEKNGTKYMEMPDGCRDVYDGLLVPMALRTDDDRLILAGWLGGIGWGSVLVHRELIQYPDGHLGMRWLPELAPRQEGLLWEARSIGPDVPFPLAARASDWYEFTVNPAKGGKAAIRFLSENPEEPSCEILFDMEEKTAQFGTPVEEGFAAPIQPAYYAIPAHDQGEALCWGLQPETLFIQSKDFAIGDVDCMEAPFPVRIVRRYSKKMDSTILDVEIGGQRTMISNRVGLHPVQLQAECTQGTTMENLKAYVYEEEEIPTLEEE